MPYSTNPGYNKLLSGLSVQYKNHSFVSDQVWKPLKVKMQTGNYLVFDKTLYDIANTERGIRQASVSAEMGWTNAVYALQRHSLNMPVYREEKDEVDNDVDLPSLAVQWIKEKLLLEQEALAFGANSPLNSTSSTNNGGTSALDLSNLNTADWKDALSYACSQVEINAGVSPNMIVMNPDILRNIVATTQFQSSVQYVLPTTQVGGLALPDNLLGLPIKVVQAIANSANDGQAVSNSRIMPSNIWVGYVAPQPMQKYVLTYGARFWSEDRVVVEHILDPEADKYINDYNYQFKVIAPECGFLLTVTPATNY